MSWAEYSRPKKMRLQRFKLQYQGVQAVRSSTSMIWYMTEINDVTLQGNILWLH